MSLMFDGVYCTPLPVAFEFLSLVHIRAGHVGLTDLYLWGNIVCIYYPLQGL